MARGPLSLVDLLCLGVNAIVGSGIYAFPGLLAEMLGPASFLAFAACGLVSLFVALCFAETASMFERSGGPYVYADAAFGRGVGYLVGWTCWAAAVVSWAAVTRALLPYLGHLVASLRSRHASTAVAALLTIALGAVNYAGIKPGAYTADLLTVAKLLPLIVLAAGGLWTGEISRFRPFAPRGLSALPRATLLSFFAFQGFEVVPVPAAESTDPRRNVPIAVLGSLIGSTVFYMIIQVAAIASTPNLAGTMEPLAEMGTTIFGQLGGQLVSAAAVVSMLGFCAGVALASPRYLEALAIDGFVHRSLAQRHARFDTPHRCIAVTTAATVVFVIVLDFGPLVDLAVLTVAVQYLATCAAVPVLRRRMATASRARRPVTRRATRERSDPEAQSGTRGNEPALRLPLGPVVPLLAVGVVLWLMGLRLAEEQDSGKMALGFGAMLAIGVIVALVHRAVERRG
jgi:amino acid transporter